MAEKTVMILTSQNNWDEWIKVIKTKAMADSIQAYINPDTPKSTLPSLEEPKAPKPRDIDPQKTTFSSLDEGKKEELRELRQDYKRKLNKHDRQQRVIGALHIHIQDTVSHPNLTYTFNCDIVHSMLTNLKLQLSPSNKTREQELVYQYQKLQAPPMMQNIDEWLRDWQRTYKKYRKLQLPDTKRERAVRDFLRTVNTIEPGFSSYWRNKLIDGDSRIDLYKIIQQYHNHQSKSPRLSQGAFTATFKGEKAEKLKDCLCSKTHHFKQCPYIVEGARKRDWKPDPRVKQGIKEKI